jgi:predicted CXXCH cytochrome family protein
MTGYMILLFLFLFLPSGRLKTAKPDTGNAECITCHGDLIKNNVVHPDLESTCDICHAPTGSVHPQKNIKGFTLTEKLPVLCFNCHTEFQQHLEKYPSVHGPLRDSLSCLNCHNPHSSPQQKLLTDGTNNLCLNCHNRTISNESVRIENISQILSKAKSVHQAIEGGCVTCHNPHFSEKRLLLIGNFPASQYVKGTTENYEICFMCHDADLIEAKSTITGTNFRNGKTNLHYVHLKGEKGRSCTMCHDVHGSVNDRLILDKLKFGNWEMKIRFEISENGGSCLTACHSEKKYDRTVPKEVVPAVQPKKKK